MISLTTQALHGEVHLSMVSIICLLNYTYRSMALGLLVLAPGHPKLVDLATPKSFTAPFALDLQRGSGFGVKHSHNLQ